MLSLHQIIGDLEYFLIVLALFMLMFGHCFFILMWKPASDDDLEDPNDDYEPAPFETVRETLLSVFRMMLGDFQRGWFSTDNDQIDDASVLVFVTFVFVCNIVLLNVLIAVVSDSYDYAQTRAANLFLRARIELAAELVAVGAAKHTAGETTYKGQPGLLRAKLERILRTMSDDDEAPSGESEWLGRALDQERRTQHIVEENVAMLQMDLARVETKTERAQQALENKIAKLEEHIIRMESSIAKAIEERIERSVAKAIEERIEKCIAKAIEERVDKAMEKCIEASNEGIAERIQKSNKEIMEAIQQLKR